MSDEHNQGGASDNVVIFPVPVRPAPPEKEPRPSAVATASLAEATRRKEIARMVEPRLSDRKAMDFPDRIALARNVRNYIYGLEAAGQLSVRQVGARAFNREEVRAIQQYVLPHGIETQAEYEAKHPNRPLAGKPARYLSIMEAAAGIAGEDRDAAILALARGTRFWPGAEHVADEERRAANEIVELLYRIPAHLDEVFPLGGYFDLVEQQRILPRDRDGGIVFRDAEEFGWWDFAAMPSVRMANRWLKPHTVPVVVAVSETKAGGKPVRVDFDAVHGAGRSFEAWVSRRQIFSLGIGRISGTVGPVAILTHEVVLPNGTDYKVGESRGVDRLCPGWNRCTVDLGDGPLLAAWQIKDALDNPPDPDEQEYDAPPDVHVSPITADWLLEQKEDGWMMPKTSSFVGTVYWQVIAQVERGRIGPPEGLPSIIERCLLAQSASGGPVTEIAGRYTAFAQALKEWRALLNEKAQRKLGQVAARLAGQLHPAEDHLDHLD